MMKIPSSFASLLVVLTLVACAGEREAKQEAPGPAVPTDELSIYTVNYPLAYFAERIGGERVEVSFPAPADVDPADWSPDAETVAAYQSADLILLNGVDYARWLPRVSLPSSKLVDTSSAFADRYAPLEEQVVHTHGPTGEHSHGGWASTTWLDPALAREQADAVGVTLIATDPEGESVYAENFTALQTDLDRLDAELTRVAVGLGARPILFSHPVYQYLVRRFGLKARSVHWEPDEVPDEEAWSELERLLEEHPARWMIWEAEPLPEIAERLDSLGVAVTVYEPCANTPPTGDWLTVMQSNVHNLHSATNPDPPQD